MALYVPAGTAVTVQVKTVCVEVPPGSGPVGEVHEVADPPGPVRPHAIEPAGDVAPAAPVTVAV